MEQWNSTILNAKYKIWTIGSLRKSWDLSLNMKTDEQTDRQTNEHTIGKNGSNFKSKVLIWYRIWYLSVIPPPFNILWKSMFVSRVLYCIKVDQNSTSNYVRIVQFEHIFRSKKFIKKCLKSSCLKSSCLNFSISFTLILEKDL